MDISVLLHGELLKNVGASVFKVKDEQHRYWTAKLYPEHEWGLAEKQAEIGRFLMYLNEKLPDLPLPLPHPDGVQKIDYGAMLGQGRDERLWVSSRWIAGRRIPAKVCAHWAYAFGQTLARLHMAAREMPFKLQLPHLDAHFVAKVQERILSAPLFLALGAPFKVRVAEQMRYIQVQMEAIGYSEAAYGPIHTDLHLGNWLDVSGRPVPIDFDYTAYGHFGLDWAVLHNDLALRVPPADRGQAAASLWNGYAAHGPYKGGGAQDTHRVFIQFAEALYLNWALAPENMVLLERPQLLKRAKMALRKLAVFPH